MITHTAVDIGFMSTTYTASEADSSVEVCAELVSGETDIAVQVELRTQPGNAQGILVTLACNNYYWLYCFQHGFFFCFLLDSKH